jgi:hypothetical protein
MLGAVNKQVASGFAGVVQRTISQSDASASSIIGAADVYRSDFGLLRIVPNRFQRARDGWFLDFNLVEVGYIPGRAFKPIELAIRGDAKERMVLAEYVHKVFNEKGLGLAADLS